MLERTTLLYNLFYRKPEPFVPRFHVLGVPAPLHLQLPFVVRRERREVPVVAAVNHHVWSTVEDVEPRPSQMVNRDTPLALGVGHENVRSTQGTAP